MGGGAEDNSEQQIRQVADQIKGPNRPQMVQYAEVLGDFGTARQGTFGFPNW